MITTWWRLRDSTHGEIYGLLTLVMTPSALQNLQSSVLVMHTDLQLQRPAITTNPSHSMQQQPSSHTGTFVDLCATLD